MTQLKSILFVLLASFALTACGNKLSQTGLNDTLQSDQLSLRLIGLQPMVGQHYEGWVVDGDGPTSTGRFSVDADGSVNSVDADGQFVSSAGNMESARFKLTASAKDAKAFVLTIEPNGDTDAGPSDVHYLAGNFDNAGTTVARTDHGSAIATEFSAVAGSYILATPTNGPTTHNQGIWYLAANAATLLIPTLATGWAYEGWVVDTDTGTPTSTGIFFTASGADDDGPGDGAGPITANIPLFPGQDFIDPARVLNAGNTKAVITVEPYPDFDPAPFTIKILANDIAQDAAVTTSFDLNNIANDEAIYIEATVK